MSINPGARIGVFEIVAKIGEGGMSARGRASERSETSPSAWGWGPTQLLKEGTRAYAA